MTADNDWWGLMSISNKFGSKNRFGMVQFLMMFKGFIMQLVADRYVWWLGFMVGMILKSPFMNLIFSSLLSQKRLGFTTTVPDRINSWMLWEPSQLGGEGQSLHDSLLGCAQLQQHHLSTLSIHCAIYGRETSRLEFRKCDESGHCKKYGCSHHDTTY